MTFGLSLEDFTLLHTVLSLVGIATGLIVAFGMLANARLDGWTAIFLVTTVLTSVTGFFFPFAGVTPAIIVGAISMAVLAIAIAARYLFDLRGPWRWIYVVTALAALYLNSFVGVVQAFQKQPFLQPLAPTQSEPPFLIAQAAVLIFFVVIGAIALRRFHPDD